MKAPLADKYLQIRRRVNFPLSVSELNRMNKHYTTNYKSDSYSNFIWVQLCRNEWWWHLHPTIVLQSSFYFECYPSKRKRIFFFFVGRDWNWTTIFFRIDSNFGHVFWSIILSSVTVPYNILLCHLCMYSRVSIWWVQLTNKITRNKFSNHYATLFAQNILH